MTYFGHLKKNGNWLIGLALDQKVFILTTTEWSAVYLAFVESNERKSAKNFSKKSAQKSRYLLISVIALVLTKRYLHHLYQMSMRLFSLILVGVFLFSISISSNFLGY